MNTKTTSAQSSADSLPKAHFCLRCVGNCMASSGIKDGDIVFVNAHKIINNGDIAVVQIDGRRYLKRFYAVGNKITLVADDPSFKPWVFVGDQRYKVTVIGKAVGYLSHLQREQNREQVSDLAQDQNDTVSTTEEEALEMFRSMTPEERTQTLDWMKTRISRSES